MCSKKYGALLALCFLASSLLLAQSSPSPAGMTDAEIVAELMSNLEKREASIAKQEAQLKLDRQLLENERAIFESRKQLQTETELYWKNYKKETLKSKVLAFLGGFAAGFSVGNYTGFKLGASIDY
jgi:hypothetical protein